MLRSMHLDQFNQCDVHLLLDRAEYDVAIGGNPLRSHVTALGLCPRRSGLSPVANPADRARRRNAKTRRCSASRQTAISP
ncbi:hypothetical protein ASE85_18330 [Sphingobium sp. Leaf26]|nr:hypothetical protein ASE85_18330 [Sphingobium sp. Leaf26]